MIARVALFVLAFVVTMGAALVVAVTVPMPVGGVVSFVVGALIAVAWVVADTRLAEDKLPPFA